MSLSQTEKIVRFLQQYAGQKFTAREITKAITQQYVEDYREKRQGFENEENFLAQVVSEIGAQKNGILKKSPHIYIQDQPRPRVFWFDTVQQRQNNPIIDDIESGHTMPQLSAQEYTEHDLYPLLMSYLHSELGLYARRIDEKRSKNSKGAGGNQWLHPDIVAMQALDKNWDALIKTCIKHSTGQNVRLWSFEVKKELNSSNVRSSFFQAVSNSSWAHEGYLVCTGLDHHAEEELRMLSPLHGIGLILLNVENPSESDMIIPAQRRSEADWQTINRIVEENSDFKDYIKQVSIYYEIGHIYEREWFKFK